MSIAVGLAALYEQIDAFGPQAFLVTVSDDGAPHVVSVLVGRSGDDLEVGAGRTSRANVGARSVVTLLWSPPAGDGAYSLIVDGTGVASDDGDSVAIRPTAAVLHRIVGAAGDGPSCVPVLPRG